MPDAATGAMAKSQQAEYTQGSIRCSGREKKQGCKGRQPAGQFCMFADEMVCVTGRHSKKSFKSKRPDVTAEDPHRDRQENNTKKFTHGKQSCRT